ncbi:30S ribosomal protein S8 [Candidatus Parcubacteria bacterium]|nr:30S ribosomal protein S8 [Candidatus Parcubacteria bacterium]
MTDPIADMLVRLVNASRAKHASVLIPHSKLKFAILQILKREGFVGEIVRRGKRVAKRLEVALLYQEEGAALIESARRISRPGKRVYMPVARLRPQRFHRGLIVISTPQGIMTNQEAAAAKVGGEVLCEIR